MKLFRTYNNQTDEKLMVFIQKGDHQAFSELYDRYSGKLKAFFYRMLWSDNEMAEDFVQELFAKIIEQPEKFNPSYSFSPWIFQVASNMCKNHYRKKEFEEEYMKSLTDNGLFIAKTEDKIDETIKTDMVKKLLASMEREKRDLFVMRYQQQLSISELARVFNTSEGTIKSRLFHIRKYLLSYVNGEQKIRDHEK